MVEQVLRLADRPVRTIMTRRRDSSGSMSRIPKPKCARKIADNTYSRLLVCEGDLGQLLGYVRARALVDRLIEQAPLDLRSLFANRCA